MAEQQEEQVEREQGITAADAPRNAACRSMCVGIVGLGLIGGSFARAYRSLGATVYALDTDRDTMDASMIETVEAPLDDASIPSCDLIILAAYPQACIEWLEEHAEILGRISDPDTSRGPIVIDTAGVKEAVCARAFELARVNGFAFVGTHPMAGTQFSGFAHARADLFRGAPMVLVPPETDDARRLTLLDRAHTLLAPAGHARTTGFPPEAIAILLAWRT